MDINRAAADYLADREATGELSEATLVVYRWELQRFASYTDAGTVNALTKAGIDRWWRRIGRLAATTRAHWLSTVRGFLAWCATNGLGASPALVAHLRRPRPARRVPRVLTATQVRAVLQVCEGPRDRLIIVLMVQLGLRRGEVAALPLRAIDWSAETILVVGKGGHERVVPITGEAMDALHTWIRARPRHGDRLICDAEGGPLSANWLGKLVIRRMQTAGVKVATRDGASAHALRRTCATDVLRAGATITDVQALLGHSQLASTAHYLAHPAADRLRQVVDGRRYA